MAGGGQNGVRGGRALYCGSVFSLSLVPGRILLPEFLLLWERWEVKKISESSCHIFLLRHSERRRCVGFFLNYANLK